MKSANYRSLSVALFGLLALVCGMAPFGMAQSQLTGRIVDPQTGPLIGVPITLIAQTDSTVKKQTITDTAGVFRMADLSLQSYRLRATYPGYQNLSLVITISQPVQDLGTLPMNQDSTSVTLALATGQTPATPPDTIPQAATTQATTAQTPAPQPTSVAGRSQLTGRIVDTKKSALIGVPIILTAQADSTIKKYALSDTAGVFTITDISPQAYRLRATYLGYQDLGQLITVRQPVQNLGDLTMTEDSRTLKEVVVKGQVSASQMKGDTLQLNANAFKVTRDANTEDLVRKMPGITVENGTVTAQGETVQQVLVDGKVFFGDDPTIALRNLPAEVVDKIEVFDRQSDQSQFTGFNDGNTTKTINIVTRGDRQNGLFGRVYAGAGTNGVYTAGGNVNQFKGARRLSVIGLSNNINQQNFASQDLLGVTNAGGGNAGGRGGGGGRGGTGGGGAPGGGNNFQVGQQSGINKTNSLGINFSDDWGKHVTFRGSYFFNNSNNRNVQTQFRRYFLTGDASQFYQENSQTSSENYNHRFDFRLEYTINSNNSLLITPRVRFQNTNSTSGVNGITYLSNDSTLLNPGAGNSFNPIVPPDSALLNRSTSNYTSRNQGYDFANNILFRHRFAKRGRSLSLNLGSDVAKQTNNNTQMSLNEYFTDSTRSQRIDQQTHVSSPSYQLSLNTAFTEPLGKFSQLQLNYNVSYRNSNSDRRTNRLNPLTNRYDSLNLQLSNTFQNDYLTNQAGVGYNFRNPKAGLNANLTYQRADLISDQTFPRVNHVRATFNNLLPSATFDYRLTTDARLRVNYRTNTQAPSVTQLQNVLDNSNPLFLTLGNPDLKQSYSHNVQARYTLTKPTKSRSLFILLSGNATNNYIANATNIGTDTSQLISGVRVGRGVQLSRPINLNGLWAMRTFLTYSFPIKVAKLNLSLNAGNGYSQTPGSINGRLNLARTTTWTEGVVLSSNISEKLDFSASYTGNFNEVKNTIQPQLNNTYYYSVISGRINWIFGPGLVFQADINNQRYKGFSGSVDQQYTLLNAAVGKKFLKDQRGDLRISAFDLLKQNNSLSVTQTDTYVQNSQSLVLQRYFLLTFTYSLRQFKAAAAPARPDGQFTPPGANGNGGFPGRRRDG